MGEKVGRNLDDRWLASALMYPQVFSDFMAGSRKYGPLAALPTPTFFYGMEVGQEIAIDLEWGKTLVVRLQAIGQTREDGTVSVFFELNGQPRVIKAPNRSATVTATVRRKADESNASHMAAPMPGMIVVLSVQPGAIVKAGDALLSMEAMKMETALRASHDGKVTAIHVEVGEAVEAKDLLIELDLI